MRQIFISSVMKGYEAERQAVRDAIESLGMQALYAGGTAPASPEPSRAALLGQIDRADGVVLILGARYGFITESGTSPTEDEFAHANATGKPIFVFVQEDVEHEARQVAFISRVQGAWAEGTFTGFFKTPPELSLKVVRALSDYRDRQRTGDAVPKAQERAQVLAAGDGRPRSSGSNFVRVVLVPVGGATLIDALVLDDAHFKDRVARVVRDHDLVPQSAGIEVRAVSAGVVLSASAPGDFHTTTITFAADGSIIADLDARGDGTMGGMVVSYPKVRAAIAATCAAAQSLWAQVPNGDLVRHVCALVSVPEASNCSLSESGQTGGSMRMPTIAMPVQAPDPPIALRRADVGTDETVRRLAVALKQGYADQDAVTA